MPTPLPDALTIEIWTGQPRPGYSHPRVVDGMVEDFLPRIMGWLKAGGCRSGEDDVRADLRRLFNSGDLDGYHLARSLDNWNPDEDLVEILGDAFSVRSSVYAKLNQAWVKENAGLIAGWCAKFAPGTKISYRSALSMTLGDQVCTGVVKRLMAEDAIAVIQKDASASSGDPLINLEKLSLIGEPLSLGQ
jgi:hypothetical protein